ncbi:hypothetical protein [Streptomyces sp. NRRL S-1813]|uniref:hypothetical protein n=1 Tax=Streptomyces sp. NRRL S-1813 TaxID=1463888 RepID=UPI00131C5E08|nr:hypothetical protein [Streptomyces sp. NRRL S-1813]
MQGDLAPAGKRFGVRRPCLVSAHSVGNVTLEPGVVTPAEEIFGLVHSVLRERDRRSNDVPGLALALGVLKVGDSPFGCSKVGRSGLQSVRRVLRIKRAVLEARAQILGSCCEGIRSGSVPVLTDIRHSLVQQVPHTAIRRIASELVMHVHPVVGDLVDLVRLRVSHHGLQRLKRVA